MSFHLYRNLILFFILTYFHLLSGQVHIDSTLVGKKISRIYISGNETTQSDIILRELKQQTGDTLQLNLTVEDWNRIQNLNLFSRVEITTKKDHDEVIVSIHVSEKWYWIPYPVFYINEKDWSKLSYGAGIVHSNFRGRAESLLLEGIFGYNPLVNCQYVNPWIFGKHQFYWGIQGFFKKIRNKYYSDQDLYEQYSGFMISLGKRFGYHVLGQLSLGYENIRFSPDIPGYTLSGTGSDKVPLASMIGVLDYRDLREYPHQGWYFKSYISKMGLPSNSADYIYYGLELRKYFPVGSWTLAFLTNWILSDGEIPIYDRIYFGYSTRIRGHFFEEDEGENRGLGSVALHIPILPIRYVYLTDNHYMKDLKFGISLGFFADTGLIWYQDEPLSTSMLITGYGAGLHFHLPYIHLLRLEAAFNETGHVQFIADIGVDI